MGYPYVHLYREISCNRKNGPFGIFLAETHPGPTYILNGERNPSCDIPQKKESNVNIFLEPWNDGPLKLPPCFCVFFSGGINVGSSKRSSFSRKKYDSISGSLAR